MTDHRITEQEHELLLEVLEAERRRLLRAIRQTDGREMGTGVEHRLHAVERLIAELEERRAEIPRAGTR